jgi:predicted RNase H-like HicB family nuclease
LDSFGAWKDEKKHFRQARMSSPFGKIISLTLCNDSVTIEAGRTQGVNMDYLVILEETQTGYSSYAPDLPGCAATGKTIDELRERMREAVEFHVEGLRLEGMQVPPPSSKALFFDLAATGVVKGERIVETIYDIKSFAVKAGITPSTARVYAHRFGIGRKLGRGWIFTDADLLSIPRRAKVTTR